MKYLIALLLLAPLFLVPKNSFAITPKVDSVYADSCYQDGINGVSYSDSIKMFRTFDGLYGQLKDNGSLIDMAFKKYKSNALQTIKAGSTVLVWGKKDLSVDSSAGQIIFNKVSSDGSLIASSKPFILGDGINVITVPNDDYTYLELTLAEPIDNGSKNHAKSYFVDAVALVQDTTTPIINGVDLSNSGNSISSYPNPFITATTIRYELASEGEIQFSVIDAMGREIDHENAGYMQSGVHEIPLAIRTPGFYFVRLFVNGQPAGKPLKITSR
jgi:hypothetical protein